MFYTILYKLKKLIKGDFLIAGIGNEENEIDKIGIEIVKECSKFYPEKFMNCGVAIENYLDKIIKIKNEKLTTADAQFYLIIIDVVRFNGSRSVKIFTPEELTYQGISTHAISLKLICEYLKNFGINSIIIGIKPNKNMKIKKKLINTLKQLINVLQPDIYNYEHNC